MQKAFIKARKFLCVFLALELLAFFACPAVCTFASDSACACLHSQISNGLSDNSWGEENTGILAALKLISQGAVEQSRVTIGLIDTGVDYENAVFEGRVIKSGINTSSSGLKDDAMDDCGHGTQIASVIAHCTAQSVKIRAYKALDIYGNGDFLNIAEAINSAVSDNVDIINLSFGFFEYSACLEEAINNALSKGIIVVAAAGNQSSSRSFYPSSFDSVIRVAAIGPDGKAANFNNTGDIDFFAPGVYIQTTGLKNTSYISRGTSISAAFVTSVFAIVKAVCPHLTNEEIYFAINSASLDFDGSKSLMCPEIESIENLSVFKADALTTAKVQKIKASVRRNYLGLWESTEIVIKNNYSSKITSVEYENLTPDIISVTSSGDVTCEEKGVGEICVFVSFADGTQYETTVKVNCKLNPFQMLLNRLVTALKEYFLKLSEN